MGMEEKISNSHAMFSIACIIQGSVLLSSFIIGISRQDSWIVVIAGLLFSLLFSFVYIALAQKFSGCTLVQINDAVFGKAAGRGVSALYLFFFLSLCALNTRDLGGFVTGNLLSGTPEGVVVALFVLVCAWAVRKGICSLLRLSPMICILALVVIGFNATLLIKEYRLEAFLPVLNQPPLKLLQATQIITAIPYLETVAFLMIFPRLRETDKIKKTFFGGLALGALTMLTVVARDIGVLGNMAGQFAMPTYQSMTLIAIADVLTRMEVLFSALFITLQFYKVSILYYVTVKITEQTFGMKRQGSLVPVIGALIVPYALTVFQSGSENTFWAGTVAPFFSNFFEMVLPVLTLLVAAIRFPRQRGRPPAGSRLTLLHKRRHSRYDLKPMFPFEEQKVRRPGKFDESWRKIGESARKQNFRHACNVCDCLCPAGLVFPHGIFY